jgi:isoquinoline 1-oxidoreductase alpha subunit
MPLLWALRDLLGLTGTKYGCGEDIIGACTVREGAQALRSCQLTIAEAAGRSFLTIEGLAAADGARLQQAWIAGDVAQCGFCQPGMLMAVSALFAADASPTDAAISAALDGNLCRCRSPGRARTT